MTLPFRNINNDKYQNDKYHFDCLEIALDVHGSNEKVVLTGGFNAPENECVFNCFLINMI